MMLADVYRDYQDLADMSTVDLNVAELSTG